MSRKRIYNFFLDIMNLSLLKRPKYAENDHFWKFNELRPQKLRRLPLLPVIQRAAALKSLVREANQTFRAKNYVDYPYYP